MYTEHGYTKMVAAWNYMKQFVYCTILNILNMYQNSTKKVLKNVLWCPQILTMEQKMCNSTIATGSVPQENIINFPQCNLCPQHWYFNFHKKKCYSCVLLNRFMTPCSNSLKPETCFCVCESEIHLWARCADNCSAPNKCEKHMHIYLVQVLSPNKL